MTARVKSSGSVYDERSTIWIDGRVAGDRGSEGILNGLAQYAERPRPMAGGVQTVTDVTTQMRPLSRLITLVDLRGLEPLTPCMPCRCATSCATDPDRFPLERATDSDYTARERK